MRPTKSTILAVLLISVSSLSSNRAMAANDKFRAGLVLGAIGLTGDPGQGGVGGVAAGFTAQYDIEQTLVIDLQYVGSLHPKVEHREFSLGADYLIPVEEWQDRVPFLSAGMSFLSNTYKELPFSGEAVGIYLGAGIDFDIGKTFEWQRRIIVGPQLRYQKVFESKGVVDQREVISVADSYSVLLRVLYTPGETEE